MKKAAVKPRPADARELSERANKIILKMLDAVNDADEHGEVGYVAILSFCCAAPEAVGKTFDEFIADLRTFDKDRLTKWGVGRTDEPPPGVPATRRPS